MMLQPTRRLVLYSHDTMGLGHTRRNLLIALGLSESRTPPATLMVFGANEARAWDLPPGVESLTLPAVKKGPNGRYTSRRMAVPLEAVIRIRSQVIAASLAAFDPDLVIVDKVPGGLAGELLPAIKQLRRRGRARLVLGLRDVLDDPSVVRSEWIREGNYQLVADSFDAVWVYGDRTIANPVEEYGFGPEIATKLHYTGYLDPRFRASHRPAGPRPLDQIDGPVALCLLGGGQDGAPLAGAFAAATFPTGTTGVLVAGPEMPEADYQNLMARFGDRPDLRILRFVADADALIARATQVVAMGGYNTVVEILAHERRALIVPRVEPRTEQLIRAERLATLGMVDMLLPGAATPSALTDWLAGPPVPRVRARTHLDFGGLGRVNLLSRALLATRPMPRFRGLALGTRALASVAG